MKKYGERHDSRAHTGQALSPAISQTHWSDRTFCRDVWRGWKRLPNIVEYVAVWRLTELYIRGMKPANQAFLVLAK